MMSNLKRNAGGEENGITEIEKKSINTECKNTGKKNKWIKNCPKCGREQTYSTAWTFKHAIQLNRICIFCKNSGEGNPFFGKHHSKRHKKWLSETQLAECSFRYKKEGKNPSKIRKNCKRCGKIFFVIESQLNRKYHNYDCAVKDNFGFAYNKKTSPELKFESWLVTNGIAYQSPFHLKGKLYDFYIPHKNLLIEVDGVYWHGKGLNDDQLNTIQSHNRKNDDIKNRLAQEKGYTLKRIWEDEITEEVCTLIFT